MKLVGTQTITFQQLPNHMQCLIWFLTLTVFLTAVKYY